MKTIIIIRHAKSSWVDFSLSDYDRGLDQRGLRDGPVMALRLQQAGYVPQRIISSSAVRAKSTAAYFSDIFKVPVEEVRYLYHGLPEDYLDVLHGLTPDCQCAALVGHNPGITVIANMIRDGYTENVPTCGILIAQSDEEQWSNITWSDMKMVSMMVPKDNGT